MLACDQCICTFESFLSLFFREDDVWGFVFKKKTRTVFVYFYLCFLGEFLGSKPCPGPPCQPNVSDAKILMRADPYFDVRMLPLHSLRWLFKDTIRIQNARREAVSKHPASLHRRTVSSRLTSHQHAHRAGGRAAWRVPAPTMVCRNILASPPPHFRPSDRRPCGRGARGCTGPRACSPVRCSSADDGSGCWCSRSNTRAPDKSRKGSRVRPAS